MRILHLPTNIAGQPLNISKTVKSLGYKCNLLSNKNKFNYDNDLLLSDSSNIFIRQINKIVIFFKAIFKYDVFHYHTDGLLYLNIDVLILKLLRKKIFIQFHGSEIRLYEQEKKRNRFFRSDNITDQKSKIRRLKFWSFITDNVIVCDHSLDLFLKPYFKNIHAIGQILDVDKFIPEYPSIDNDTPILVHAPSVKSTKGTEYVDEAIKSLKNKGINFNYIEVHNMSHEEALKIYQTADIVIDQLLIGSYGIVSCESMALGKPVVCYILDENVIKYGKELPIINANPETIENVLEELILSPEKRNIIGKKSRLYAKKTFNSKIVAEKLIKIYET